MSIKDTINEDMKNYMRSKDTLALEAVRMLKSEIKNKEIDEMKELTDDGVLKIIHSTIKKNKEAAEIYAKAARKDLEDKENRYSEVLSKYLPAQMGEGELQSIVKAVLADMPDVDPKTGFGVVMKAVLAKVGNQADGKTVSAVVKQTLEGAK
ncbi:MAG: GatB/YqeY domain-containing protein [Deferribacteraceae bacterium]|jgi:uncharacterized protein YqeY|nr:GatB/YqeY domain-containing protein [Deferribacteraceae bacterium]